MPLPNSSIAGPSEENLHLDNANNDSASSSYYLEMDHIAQTNEDASSDDEDISIDQCLDKEELQDLLQDKSKMNERLEKDLKSKEKLLDVQRRMLDDLKASVEEMEMNISEGKSRLSKSREHIVAIENRIKQLDQNKNRKGKDGVNFIKIDNKGTVSSENVNSKLVDIQSNENTNQIPAVQARNNQIEIFEIRSDENGTEVPENITDKVNRILSNLTPIQAEKTAQIFQADGNKSSKEPAIIKYKKNYKRKVRRDETSLLKRHRWDLAVQRLAEKPPVINNNYNINVVSFPRIDARRDMSHVDGTRYDIIMAMEALKDPRSQQDIQYLTCQYYSNKREPANHHVVISDCFDGVNRLANQIHGFSDERMTRPSCRHYLCLLNDKLEITRVIVQVTNYGRGSGNASFEDITFRDKDGKIYSKEDAEDVKQKSLHVVVRARNMRDGEGFHANQWIKEYFVLSFRGPKDWRNKCVLHLSGELCARNHADVHGPPCQRYDPLWEKHHRRFSNKNEENETIEIS